jgi:hypothetical protein
MLINMAHRAIRRFFIILSLLAFAGTASAQAVNLDIGQHSGSSMTMPDMSDTDVPMPCCPGKAVSCVTDMGCVFLVGLPLPASMPAIGLILSQVTYPISHDNAEGLSTQPALGPPILLV